MRIIGRHPRYSNIFVYRPDRVDGDCAIPFEVLRHNKILLAWFKTQGIQTVRGKEDFFRIPGGPEVLYLQIGAQ